MSSSIAKKCYAVCVYKRFKKPWYRSKSIYDIDIASSHF